MLKKFAIFVWSLSAVLLVAFLLAFVFVGRSSNESLFVAEAASSTPSSTQTLVTPTSTETAPGDLQVPTETQTPTPTLTPTATPVVSGFQVLSRVSLANGLPMAIIITRTDGEVFASSWAVPIGYDGSADMSEVFNPYRGTVYSYFSDSLSVWMHSGVISKGDLFAQSWVSDIVYDSLWKIRDTEAALAELELFRNSQVMLCQVEVFDETLLFSPYDTTAPCPGKSVSFELTALALVMKPQVAEYEAHVLDVRSWLALNYPESGFAALSQADSLLLLTCAGQFNDQPREAGDSTESYLFNRLVFGLRVVEGQ